jgi:GGDEF domain-containing protein
LKLFASFLDTTVKAFYQNFIPEYSPIIARQSGDEFQIILPNITLEMMEDLAKNIHDELKHIDYYAKSNKADSNNRVHRIPLLTSI